MHAPTGLTLYQPAGRTPLEDTNTLADCLASSAANLFNHGDLIWVHDGKRTIVNLNALTEIIAKYLVTGRAVERDGSWVVEFDPVVATQAALVAMLMTKRKEEGSLLARLPKVSGKLTESQKRDIRARLGRNEPASQLAYAFGCDVEVIERLAR